MDSSYMLEMTGIFLDEVDEQLHIIDREILKLEQFGSSEETIQSLFRAAHTLKGSSAAMGFEEMKHLTHEMEHILDQVRNHRLQVTDGMTNLLFACLDHLKLLKEQFAYGSGISTDITGLIKELQNFSPGLNELLDIRIELAMDCPMKSARALIIRNQLETWGDVVRTHPPIDEIEDDHLSAPKEIQYLLASQIEIPQLKNALLSMLDVIEVRISPYKNQSIAVKSAIAPNPPEASKLADKQKNRTIRVDVERLELLMNLVGELVIDQTRINQVGNILHHRYSTDENVGDLGQISDHVSRVIGELQESVMKVRMLPIEQLFNRFPRMVRDLSRSLNKEIDLIIEGKETELDRTVIEEIGDPLIHLLRNAVDHGIETAEERIRRGKPPKGLLRIAATHEENQVVITVEDDGSGIDPAIIKESALHKGIISEKECIDLTDQEAIYLIFHPGFSTAASVSDISGRGVGMDIVRNHIEKLNGVINIETELGAGTRFKIKLPLTLAIITGLLIKINDRTFILPMSSVVEIVRMPPEAIQTIKGEMVIVIRERVLPVINLHEYLHINQIKQDKKHLQVVVVGAAERRFALVVDELIGNQEIVVKTLGTYVGKIDWISGATILGDGRVALILEVASIAKLAGR